MIGSDGRMMSPEEIERIAQKRARAKLGWYLHVAVYVCFNLVIFAMSRHGFGRRPWSASPLLGWGLGLALHAFSVFVLGGSVRDRHLHREQVQRRRNGA